MQRDGDGAHSPHASIDPLRQRASHIRLPCQERSRSRSRLQSGGRRRLEWQAQFTGSCESCRFIALCTRHEGAAEAWGGNPGASFSRATSRAEAGGVWQEAGGGALEVASPSTFMSRANVTRMRLARRFLNFFNLCVCHVHNWLQFFFKPNPPPYFTYQSFGYTLTAEWITLI